MGVNGPFAGEVASVELGGGPLKVVGVEYNECCDSVFGIDPNHAQHLDLKRIRTLATDREAEAHEGKVRGAGRDDGRRDVCGQKFGDCPHVRHLGVSTVQDSKAHERTAIVIEKVVGQDLCHRIPVAHSEVSQEAFGHLACRVFQSPRLRV